MTGVSAASCRLAWLLVFLGFGISCANVCDESNVKNSREQAKRCTDDSIYGSGVDDDDSVEDYLKGDFSLNRDSHDPSSSADPTFVMEIEVPDGAIEMLVSSDRDFADAKALPIKEQHRFKFPKDYASCGEQFIYLKFRDELGVEGAASKEDVAINCWIPLPDSGEINTQNWNPIYSSQGYIDWLPSGGGYFEFSTQTWVPIPDSGLDSRNPELALTWTGQQLIFWGGNSGSQHHTDGAMWDIDTNTWITLASLQAPNERKWESTVWTGTSMIVWGGLHAGAHRGDGAAFDPATNTWDALPMASAPSGRYSHSAVWTGDEMIIYGGRGVPSNELNTGAAYDPDADSWSAISNVGAPPATSSHAAVWTGSKMIVWAGYNGSVWVNSGGVYDPNTDSWITMPTENAPSVYDRWTRDRRPEVHWTGTHMIVWTGASPVPGAIYDIDTNTWEPLPEENAPSAAFQYSAWHGNDLIVWGGDFADYPTDEPKVYDSVNNRWETIHFDDDESVGLGKIYGSEHSDRLLTATSHDTPGRKSGVLIPWNR